MIAVLFAAAVLQVQQPSELLFSEAWACSELARLGRESHFGDTTPQTTSEHAMWNALTRLETLAREEADSRGYEGQRRETEVRDAQGMIDRAGDQFGDMLEACRVMFQVKIE